MKAMPATSTSEMAKEVARPVPILPVAKPRGKLDDGGSSSSRHLGAIHKNRRPKWPDHEVTYQNTTPVNGDKRVPPPPPPPQTAYPKETDSMVRTKTILNEAADAVAKSFAKQTQGINKGKTSTLFCVPWKRFVQQSNNFCVQWFPSVVHLLQSWQLSLCENNCFLSSSSTHPGEYTTFKKTKVEPWPLGHLYFKQYNFVLK